MSSADQPSVGEQAHSDYVAGLDAEHMALLALRRELYDVCADPWGDMLSNMQASLDENPLSPKAHDRIHADMVRIAALRTYEQKYGVDLADYLPEE